LNRIDVKFDDEDKVLMLLNSLLASPTYKNLVASLIWGKETLILEEIKSALLSFNPRKKDSDKNSQGKGQVVKSNQERERNKSQNKSKNNKARYKSRKKKDIQCYKCGKTRHIK
jgi:hypothetical protein